MNILASRGNIKEALIRFRVENRWITSEGISNNSEVRMYQWDGIKWGELETERISLDSSYTYYEAKTNFFSQFAIGGSKVQSPAGPKEIMQDATQNLGRGEKPVETTMKINLFFILIIFVLTLAIIVAMTIWKKRR